MCVKTFLSESKYLFLFTQATKYTFMISIQNDKLMNVFLHPETAQNMSQNKCVTFA